MEVVRFTPHAEVAADASVRYYFAPSTSSGKLKLLRCVLAPAATSSTNASNYADITLKKGSTALCTVRSTNSSTGSALTQGTPEALSITATGEDLESTFTSPHYLLIDATPGTGVAVSLDIVAEYEVIR